LGEGVVVFEVQQNSDVTFRLYDWGRVDATTGQPRALQVDEAIACIDYADREVSSVVPVLESTAPVTRQRLFQSEHLGLWRLSGSSPFTVGVLDVPRVPVSIEGEGKLEYNGSTYPLAKGDVCLLPAVVGACPFQPHGAVTLLEIALPVAGQ
jgi:mannose-6-phosphate isomerase